MNFDPIEEFIQKNREAFDNERPSLKVWAGIEKELPKATRRITWLAYAASAAILILGVITGFLLAPVYYEYQALSELEKPGEYSELVAYFEEEIATQYTMLANNPIQSEQQSALAELDQQLEDLKVDLVRAPKGTKAKIMESIIATYETKVHLLENVVEYSNPLNFIPYDEEETL